MQGEPLPPWREALHNVIFEADTRLGRAFDLLLIVAILLSIAVVMLDSVELISHQYHQPLFIAEWVFTVLFTIEYILRLLAVRRPILYARSFFGIVDLLSILPSYIALFYAGAQSMMVVRALRILRVFRIFKLAEYIGEGHALIRALKNSRHKIAVFLYTVFIFVVIFGTSMYIIEGEDHGFTSIPKAVYWAIVTLTTVGYGDIAPQTPLGQMIASMVMIMGYAIIAVPTGIYSAELAREYNRGVTNIACTNCGEEGHDEDAEFCKYCGHRLSQEQMA